MELIELEKLSSLINEKLQHWLEAGVKHLPNMVVAIFIAILFAIIVRIVGRAKKNVL